MQAEVYVYILNHNYSNYFEQCLNSILAQTYENIKVCVFDDGSSDSSPQLIEELCDKQSVEYRLNEKIGFMNNVRMATEALTSKYFMRVDADDYCEPNLVESLVNLLENNDRAGLAFPNYEEVDEYGNTLKTVERFNFEDSVTVYDLPAHGACTLIRTSAFQAVGGYSQNIEKQDGYDIWLKFHGKYQVCNTQEVLFYYRQHNSNLTKNNRSLLMARARIFSENVAERNLDVTCVIPFRKGELNYLKDKSITLQGNTFSFEKLLKSVLSSGYISKVILVSDEQYNHISHEKLSVVARPKSLERSGTPISETISWLETQNCFVSGHVLTLNPAYLFAPEEFINGFIASAIFFNYDESFTFCSNSSLLYKHDGKGLKPIFSSEIRRENEDIYERKGLMTYINLNSSKKAEKTIGHFEIDKLSSYSIQELSTLFGL